MKGVNRAHCCVDIFLCVLNKLWKHFHTFTHLFDHSTIETSSLALLEFSFPLFRFLTSFLLIAGMVTFSFSVFCFVPSFHGFSVLGCSTSPYFVGCCCSLFAQQFLIIDFHCSLPSPWLGRIFFTLELRNCYTWLQNFWNKGPLSLYGDL